MFKHIKNNFDLRDYSERVLAITLSFMAGLMANMGEIWMAGIIICVAMVDPKWFKDVK
jgi:hypothetical protein